MYEWQQIVLQHICNSQAQEQGINENIEIVVNTKHIF